MANLQNSTPEPHKPTSPPTSQTRLYKSPEALEKERQVSMARRIQTWWRSCRERMESYAAFHGGPHDPYDAVVCFDSLNSTIDPENLRISILCWAQSAFNIAA